MKQIDPDRALQVARSAVEAAGRVAMKHYGQRIAIETKSDASPVTAADRESEAEIVRVIREAFPDHGILAEESGTTESQVDGVRWIVDPIDGTRGFTRGGKFWGALVALEVDGDVLVGAMGLPALGDVYWAAKGRGAFKNGVRCQVSSVDRWDASTISLGELRPLLSPPCGATVVELIQEAASARCYGDLEGIALVLDGIADTWLEYGVKPWDLAPARILVEEAGGRYTDFSGGTSLALGHAIASNGRLHDYALSRLSAVTPT